MYEERYFIRRMVKPLIEFFKKTNISAEELTLFRLTVGFFTVFVLFQGVYIFSLVTVIIYQIVLLLDYVDGSIARYRNNFKMSWVYVDLMMHIILPVFLLFVITISYYFEKGSLLFLILGFVAIISFLLNNLFNKESSLEKWRAVHKNLYKYNSGRFFLLKVFIKIERPLGLFFILIMLNLRGILIASYSIFYFISALSKFYSEFKSLENEK